METPIFLHYIAGKIADLGAFLMDTYRVREGDTIELLLVVEKDDRQLVTTQQVLNAIGDPPDIRVKCVSFYIRRDFVLSLLE